MEIDFNPARVPKPEAEPSQPVARRDATPAADAVSFGSVSALEDRLKELPLTRPERVASASTLVSNSKYPPDDVLDRIAVLLAIHFES